MEQRMDMPPKISLEAARVNAHLKQREAAKRIGIVPATLRSWERGITMPDLRQAACLADLYAYPMSYINFGGDAL